MRGTLVRRDGIRWYGRTRHAAVYRAADDLRGSSGQVALLLTSYRAEHDLTQTGLAMMLGMHQPAIARLEAGSHEPSLATLARLSTALGISLDVHIAPDSMVLRSA